MKRALGSSGVPLEFPGLLGSNDPKYSHACSFRSILPLPAKNDSAGAAAAFARSLVLPTKALVSDVRAALHTACRRAAKPLGTLPTASQPDSGQP